MQNSSAFQYLAIDTIHESTTNPRQKLRAEQAGKLVDCAPGRIIGLLFRCPFVAVEQNVAFQKAVRVLKST